MRNLLISLCDQNQRSLSFRIELVCWFAGGKGQADFLKIKIRDCLE
jgi:hypothetical protein